MYLFKALVTCGAIALCGYYTYFRHHQPCTKATASSMCSLSIGIRNSPSSLPIQGVSMAYQRCFNFCFFDHQGDSCVLITKHSTFLVHFLLNYVPMSFAHFIRVSLFFFSCFLKLQPFVCHVCCNGFFGLYI